MEIKSKNNLFKILTIMLSILVLSSCNSKKIEIQKEGNLNDAIKYAISEYSDFAIKKHSKTSTFFVDIEERNNDIYSFSISPSQNTIYYNENYLKDSDIKKFPTSHIVVKNQLYYWWEEGKEGDRSDIENFKKHGYLVEDKVAFGMYVNGNINENLRITYYYFCKNDLRKFEKVHSSKIEDYFRIPSSLECNQ